MDENDSKKEEIKKDEDFVKTLKDWASIRYDLAKVECAEILKTKQESIESSVDNVKKYFNYEARQYGQKIADDKDKDIRKVLEEYRTEIEEIASMYVEQSKKIQERKQELEVELTKNINKQKNVKNSKKDKEKEIKNIRETISKVSKNGNPEEIEKKNEELKKELEKKEEIEKEEEIIKNEKEKIKKEIEKLEDALELCKKDMKEQTNEKNAMRDDKFHNINNKYMVEMKDKNNLQKIIGWFRNKINGAKRFKEDIVYSFEKGLKDLKEYKIPNIKNDIDNKFKISEKKKSIEDKINEKKGIVKDKYDSITGKIGDFTDTAKEYLVDKPVNIVSKPFRAIIDQGKEYKKGIISYMANDIEEKRKRIQEHKKEIPKEENEIEERT